MGRCKYLPFFLKGGAGAHDILSEAVADKRSLQR